MRIPTILDIRDSNHEVFQHPIWMSTAEVRLFTTLLAHSKTMLEFGCGGSTVLANSLGVQTFSVENQIAFSLRTQRLLASKFSGIPRIKPVFIDVPPGSTLKWGYPDSVNAQCARYHTDVWQLLPAGVPDLVLIDGRFRMACILKTIQHVPNSVILLHDSLRESYKEFHRFCYLKQLVDELAILTIKPFTSFEFQNAMHRYELDPS
jgi:hypothetical protein